MTRPGNTPTGVPPTSSCTSDIPYPVPLSVYMGKRQIRLVDQPVFLHTVPLVDGPFRHLSIIRLRG